MDLLSHQYTLRPIDFLLLAVAKEEGVDIIDNNNDLPDGFLNSQKILITHVQKVFHRKSIFGIGGKFTKVNTIILDDSHSCIDFLNDSFKIRVTNKHNLYQRLFQLFEDDLREQGEGSFYEIKNGESTTFLLVPYWSWQDKKSEVVQVIHEYANDREVKFTWDLIKDNIDNCQCFFSGKELEISTFLSPVNQFGTFITKFSKPNSIPKAGVVAITSSFNKAKVYQAQGSIVAKSDNIFEEVSKLKAGEYINTVVIVNRYDNRTNEQSLCLV